MPRILHLTLKKWPFDLIAADIKKEEYRDDKPYWWTRLTDTTSIGGGMRKDKVFDIVKFKHGYRSDSPEMEVEWKGMEMGIGKQEWGASGEKQFIIKLGKILSVKNYVPN